MKSASLFALALSLSLANVFGQVDRITGKHFATRSEVIASHGMAATAQPLATQIAIDILKRGGSAVDAGTAKLAKGDTTYLCVADGEGNMVSLIQSNYRGMGAGIVVPGLGFDFHDRGELFSMEPGHPNVYAPGKRPFHTIIPGFVLKDGKPWLAFGVMGGDMQPQGHVQVLTNLIDFGMNVQEAGDAPRWHHEGSSEPTGEVMTDGGYVEVESQIPYPTVRELMNRHHQLRFDLGGYGGYQAILRDPETGVYYGASESRKDGCAIGY